jgi:uncharacterized spore protein YtfJ
VSLNRLFDTIERARDSANWRAAFGEPQEVEGKTLIPVAKITYGFGLGFGTTETLGEELGEEDEAVPGGEGGGAGGRATSRPVGAIVVTPEEVYFEPALDQGKVTLVGLGVAALFVVQFANTLRALFGRE